VRSQARLRRRRQRLGHTRRRQRAEAAAATLRGPPATMPPKSNSGSVGAGPRTASAPLRNAAAPFVASCATRRGSTAAATHRRGSTEALEVDPHRQTAQFGVGGAGGGSETSGPLSAPQPTRRRRGQPRQLIGHAVARTVSVFGVAEASCEGRAPPTRCLSAPAPPRRVGAHFRCSDQQCAMAAMATHGPPEILGCVPAPAYPTCAAAAAATTGRRSRGPLCYSECLRLRCLASRPPAPVRTRARRSGAGATAAAASVGASAAEMTTAELIEACEGPGGGQRGRHRRHRGGARGARLQVPRRAAGGDGRRIRGDVDSGGGRRR